MIGAPELLDDPRYASGRLRSENRAELNAHVEGLLRRRTTAEWVEAPHRGRGPPRGPVNTIDEVFADPQVYPPGPGRRRSTIPRLGDLSIIRNALDDDRHRAARPSGPRPPTHGEHTDEVLREAGLSAEEISDLRHRNVV